MAWQVRHSGFRRCGAQLPLLLCWFLVGCSTSGIEREPAITLSRGGPNEPGYSRALCGFELWRLDEASHLALANYILHHTFHIGSP